MLDEKLAQPRESRRKKAHQKERSKKKKKQEEKAKLRGKTKGIQGKRVAKHGKFCETAKKK